MKRIDNWREVFSDPSFVGILDKVGRKAFVMRREFREMFSIFRADGMMTGDGLSVYDAGDLGVLVKDVLSTGQFEVFFFSDKKEFFDWLAK